MKTIVEFWHIIFINSQLISSLLWNKIHFSLGLLRQVTVYHQYYSMYNFWKYLLSSEAGNLKQYIGKGLSEEGAEASQCINQLAKIAVY